MKKGITFELDEISYFSKDNVSLAGEDKEKFRQLLEIRFFKLRLQKWLPTLMHISIIQ